MPASFQLSDRVIDALDHGRPVVALESTLLAHGIPVRDALGVGQAIEQSVLEGGAVPATVAVLDGVVRVGLDDAGLARIAGGSGLPKLSVRDLPAAVAAGRDGATTVAATAAISRRVGLRVFATGGLGGVHRGARESFDESADLAVLAHTPILVVCAGVKSVLDVGATLERLETLSVTVVGYRTARFPGFYRTDSGHPVGWRVESPAEAAAVLTAGAELGVGAGAVVVANPLPPEHQLDPELHDRVLAQALAAAATDGVDGQALTPYLLDRFHRDTAGASLAANVRLVLANAELAGQIAVALAAGNGPGRLAHR